MSNKSNSELLKAARTMRLEPSETDTVIFEFLSGINSPRSLTVWMLYKSRDHDQLVNLTCDPFNYNTASDYYDAYVPTEFLSKSNFLELGVDRKIVARDKMLSAEAQCKATNEFITLLLNGELELARRSDRALILLARRKIASMLGSFCGEEVYNASGWGPGVTTKLKGSDVSAFNKFHLEDEITHQLYPQCKQFFPLAYPGWTEHLISLNGEQLFTPVSGNKIVTVPKNAKTDRTIAVEPGINLWIQKGIGKSISRRLRRFGIDLRKQERNQKLAKKASLDGSLATVDFSAASDTISRAVVKLLLPQSWYIMMDEARSHTGVIDGTQIQWEKFSSMGNGFTFELESLIFYSLAYACCVKSGCSIKDLSVYGDDVIIPVGAVDSFQRITETLGFTFNGKKSFKSSPFRESCGDHWFNGISVKPIYLKSRLSDIFSVMTFANKVRRLAHRKMGYGCDARFLSCWRVSYLLATRSLRAIRISDGYGDGGFIGNSDESSVPLLRAPRFIEGFRCSSLIQQAITGSADGTPLLLRGLKYGTDLSRGNTFEKRGRTKIRVTNRILVSQWYDLGPWL